MATSDITMNVLAWFGFGAVAFLGAYTAYHVMKSKVVQTVGVFLLSMLGGFAIIVLIGAAIARMTD